MLGSSGNCYRSHEQKVHPGEAPKGLNKTGGIHLGKLQNGNQESPPEPAGIAPNGELAITFANVSLGAVDGDPKYPPTRASFSWVWATPSNQPGESRSKQIKRRISAQIRGSGARTALRLGDSASAPSSPGTAGSLARPRRRPR